MIKDSCPCSRNAGQPVSGMWTVAVAGSAVLHCLWPALGLQDSPNLAVVSWCFLIIAEVSRTLHHSSMSKNKNTNRLWNPDFCFSIFYNNFVSTQWSSRCTTPKCGPLSLEKTADSERVLSPFTQSSPLKQAIKPKQHFSDLPLKQGIRPSFKRCPPSTQKNGISLFLKTHGHRDGSKQIGLAKFSQIYDH